MGLCEVAVHYLPQWHADARTALWHGAGWTAWDLVRAMAPRYEGHRAPPQPEWGMRDDSDPLYVAKEIELAASHGVCSFLYHWYYLEDGPYLTGALDQGFMNAGNLDRMTFGIVWDNRDVAATPALLAAEPPVLATGKISPGAFETMSRLLVERYFSHPSVLKIEGCPYFAILDPVNFTEGMGGPAEARAAIERLQLKAAAAGLDGLHVSALLWRLQEPQRWEKYGGAMELVEELGVDSVGPACFADHYDVAGDSFPRGSYAKASAANFRAWDEARQWKVPYVPNVTIGFDATAHCCPTDRFERRSYPWWPVLEGNTPAAVRSAFEHARTWLGRPETKLKMMTISSWNDWTHGAALLPDHEHGACYLEMLKRVFAR